MVIQARCTPAFRGSRSQRRVHCCRRHLPASAGIPSRLPIRVDGTGYRVMRPAAAPGTEESRMSIVSWLKSWLERRRLDDEDFLGRGLRRGAIGAALGIVAALGVTRLLGSVLFGISATDAISFARALALVLGVVILATLVPASRAARTNPLRALRHQ